jgi:hypothetical protein
MDKTCGTNGIEEEWIRVLVEKPEGTRNKCTWDDNIKIDIR